MNASLSEEYKEIQELIAASKNIATQLKETLSQIKHGDPELNTNGKKHLLRSMASISDAEECYDIVLEKITRARYGAAYESYLSRETTVVSDKELECFKCGAPILYGQTALLTRLQTGTYHTVCETCRKPEERKDQ